MRFRLYREYGALNSPPVFDAFEKGLRSLGHEIVTRNEDVAVIWSVLWQGRMARNQQVYQSGKPIVIIEVGNLHRGKTWRISLNHINGLGEFGNQSELDLERPNKLKVSLQPVQESRQDNILIAGQHKASQQWIDQPAMTKWVEESVANIRKYSDRNIVFRPHPRSVITVNIPGVIVELPKQIPNSYDDFDINYNYHCVVNHNSGPAVQAAIAGVPIICDSSSLAYPVSDKFENIENIALPDRQEWFLKLCHTEWTVEEIAQGIPLQRLNFK
jgi:hypothetical protein